MKIIVTDISEEEAYTIIKQLLKNGEFEEYEADKDTEKLLYRLDNLFD